MDEKSTDLLRFDLNGWQGLLVHDIADVPVELDEDVRLVITGHSHKPGIEWRGERLYLNPGSAGRRRFKLPVTLALLELFETSIEPRLIYLVEWLASPTVDRSTRSLGCHQHGERHFDEFFICSDRVQRTTHIASNLTRSTLLDP